MAIININKNLKIIVWRKQIGTHSIVIKNIHKWRLFLTKYHYDSCMTTQHCDQKQRENYT